MKRFLLLSLLSLGVGGCCGEHPNRPVKDVQIGLFPISTISLSYFHDGTCWASLPDGDHVSIDESHCSNAAEREKQQQQIDMIRQMIQESKPTLTFDPNRAGWSISK